MGPLLLAAGRVAVFLGLAFIVGTRVLPVLFRLVARLGSSELFLLAVFGTALIAAVTSSVVFGLGLALGAFVAGLLISESELSYQAIAEIVPFRDLFAVLFFVSVGMLVDPLSLAAQPGALLVLVVVAVVVKGVLSAGLSPAVRAARALGHPPRGDARPGRRVQLHPRRGGPPARHPGQARVRPPPRDGARLDRPHAVRRARRRPRGRPDSRHARPARQPSRPTTLSADGAAATASGPPTPPTGDRTSSSSAAAVSGSSSRAPSGRAGSAASSSTATGTDSRTRRGSGPRSSTATPRAGRSSSGSASTRPASSSSRWPTRSLPGSPPSVLFASTRTSRSRRGPGAAATGRGCGRSASAASRTRRWRPGSSWPATPCSGWASPAPSWRPSPRVSVARSTAPTRDRGVPPPRPRRAATAPEQPRLPEDDDPSGAVAAAHRLEGPWQVGQVDPLLDQPADEVIAARRRGRAAPAAPSRGAPTRSSGRRSPATGSRRGRTAGPRAPRASGAARPRRSGPRRR